MADEKIYMLNALWFKAEGGREKYAEYTAAVSHIVGPLGAKVKTCYKADAEVMGVADMGAWEPDLLFFVEWPSLAAFEAAGQHPDIEAARELKAQAVDKALLIRCSKTEMPQI